MSQQVVISDAAGVNRFLQEGAEAHTHLEEVFLILRDILVDEMHCHIFGSQRWPGWTFDHQGFQISFMIYADMFRFAVEILRDPATVNRAFVEKSYLPHGGVRR